MICPTAPESPTAPECPTSEQHASRPVTVAPSIDNSHDRNGRPVAIEERKNDRLTDAIARWAQGRAGSIVSVAALLGFVLVAGGAISGPAERSTGQVVTMKVATFSAEKVSGYEVSREFVGRIEARRSSRLSLELDGLLAELLVDEGDRVEAGQVLASLDTQILKTQRASVVAQLNAADALLSQYVTGPRKEVIEAARADVQRWRAQTQLAGVTRRRNARLVEGNAASIQDLDDATYGERSAQAQWDAATARLSELENGTRAEQVTAQRAVVARLAAELSTIDVRLAKSILRAPFSGRIAARLLDEGTVIEAGRPVIELLETDKLELRVGVSNDAIENLQRGAKQTVWVDEKPYQATVRSLRPDRDQVTRTVSVLMNIDNSGNAIRIGDLATVRSASLVAEPGFWLPISALTESHRGLWGCFVAEPLLSEHESFKLNGASSNEGESNKVVGSGATHRLQLRELEVIHPTSDSAFVRGSLKPGEEVVRFGLQRLVPGQEVTVVR